MLNELKSGLVLFVFVMSVFLAGPPDLHFVIKLFIIFGALILGVTFSFLLTKSKEKIRDNAFSYGWLIKLNLFVALVFYIALIVFSIALVYIMTQFFNAQNESGILVAIVLIQGLWIAPLAVFILNFIPSLLFGIFHTNSNFLKITPPIFIVLSLIFVTYFVARNVTCDFKHDYACIADKAVGAANPQLCEGVEGDFRRGLCYEHVSRKINDISLCEKISDDAIQSICVRNIATNMNDPKICEWAKSKQALLNKESCYIYVQNNPSSN